MTFFLTTYIILGFIGLGVLLSVVAVYVIKSITLYDMAKNNGYKDKAILAWIPIANLYLLALMSGDAKIFGRYDIDANMLGISLIVLSIASGVVPITAIISGSLFFILLAYTYYNLYKKLDTKNIEMMTILSLLVPIVATIYLFMKKEVIFENIYTAEY